MEILQFILSFLINQFDNGKYSSLFESFKNNNFDIFKTLKDIKPESITPILKDILNKEKPQSVNDQLGLKPISNIADKDIIYSLNKYLY